jgi:hypothetical protein
MPALIVVGDTFRTPEIRHEVPLGVPDPFMFVESDGARRAVVPAMEMDRVAEVDGLEARAFEEFGYDELVGGGLGIDAIRREVFVNACAAFGVSEAVVSSLTASRSRRPSVCARRASR